MTHVHTIYSPIGRKVKVPTKLGKQSYSDIQIWQMKSIEKALKKAEEEKAKFFSHEEVSAWLKSWCA